LRVLAGLEPPDAGTVLVNGDDRPSRSGRPAVGVVFQEPRLLPWKTTAQNVEVCLAPLSLTGTCAARRAAEYLDLVGLHGFGAYYPARLSGGMQQRAAIARALAVGTRVGLLSARPARMLRTWELGSGTDRHALADEILGQLAEQVREQRAPRRSGS
jgi:ABC-type nitrate/sulfonate/bicarbonate transport system ATPase subunit